MNKSWKSHEHTRPILFHLIGCLFFYDRCNALLLLIYAMSNIKGNSDTKHTRRLRTKKCQKGNMIRCATNNFSRNILSYRFRINGGGEEKLYPLFGEKENMWYHINIQYRHSSTHIFVNLQVNTKISPRDFSFKDFNEQGNGYSIFRKTVLRHLTILFPFRKLTRALIN